MYDPILSKIKTKEDAEKLLQEIDILIDSLYKNEGNFQLTLRKEVPYYIAGIIRGQIENSGIDEETFLKGLKEKLLGLRALQLIIAIEPSEDVVERISAYVKENVGDDVVIEMIYDPTIIGGAKIVFNGLYRDFSFKKIFEREFESSKKQIMQLLDTKDGDQENNSKLNTVSAQM